MNVTTLPVGNTGQFLEGVAVSTGVRESVILSSPTDPDGFAEIVSSQPIQAYGLPVWLQGTPSIAIAGTIGGTVSTQVVSSIPFYVSQSSAPWTMNGAVAVTSNVTIQGTSSVNVLNTLTANVTNVPAVNITSSIPFFVAQSSSPWTFQGAINVSSQTAVASTFPLGVTSTQVVSSIPFFVAQSSAPWSFVETVSTAGGMSATTIALAATLNTTVVKPGPGQLYGILGSNIGSSNVFVRVYNTSTAGQTIASTGIPLVVWGIPISTSPYNNYDAGIPFSAGITILTQQQPYTASSSVAPTASTATVTLLFK